MLDSADPQSQVPRVDYVAPDIVEIWNGSEFLGTAPLVDGRWSLALSGLQYKKYSLTAEYNGLKSSPWEVSVNSIDTEDFSGLQTGPTMGISREFYTAVAQTLGSAPYHNPLTVVDTPWPDLGDSGSRCLWLMAIGNSGAGYSNFDMNLTMTFRKPYSSVSFDCMAGYATQINYASMVLALDGSGAELGRHVFEVLPYYPQPPALRRYQKISFSGVGGRSIASLRFEVRAVRNAPSGAYVWIDNLRMIG